MSFWIFLTALIIFVLAVAGGAIVLGAKRAPRKFSPVPFLLCCLAVFGLDRLPVPSSASVALQYTGMALLVYFLYRSGPFLRDLVQGKLEWRKE